MRGLLEQIFDGAPERVESTLKVDGSVRHIDIVSTMAAPCSPLVFRSLLGPIAEDWSRVHLSPVGRSDFWSMRRARKLEEFVALPQEHLVCMIRGWFVGLMLGLIDRSAMPYRIARPETAPALFSAELLSSGASERDKLPLLLESFSLAMVLASQVGNLHPLEPYSRLLQLGRFSRSDSRILNYEGMGEELRQFVDNGVLPNAIVEPLLSGEGRDQRLASAEDLIEEALLDYTDDFDQLVGEWQRLPNKLGEAPWWPGIWPQINLALNDLLAAVRKAKTEPVGRGKM